MVYWFSLPSPLFNDPLSTVIEDHTGELLGARIADDGQWRFPYNPVVPEKFRKCIIQYEDQYFYYHPGVNPGSIIRAIIQNIREKRIVSGGSTLSMQVIRLSRKGKKRTIPEKIIEILLATRMELTYKKNEILSLYTCNAPFGGNVVGLDAASWRYFGRAPSELSWAESATLAVLPNSPSLIHPGKNRDLLLIKRNRLLNRLKEKRIIDTVTCYLAKLEPLPDKPFPLPSLAPHLLTKVYLTNRGKRIRTTLDAKIQKHVNRIVDDHHNLLKFNEIHNAACLVIEVETGYVIAYVGNTTNPENPEYGSDVDIIVSPRSTGSILKPLLYCLMLDQGELLPNTLVPDIPTQFAGYSPKNYTLTYDGAVPANRALARSLNIPCVIMLKQFGIERFHHILQSLGITTLVYPANHYGLSLILGGAEGTLWELTGLFASCARILNHYNEYNGQYDENDIHQPICFINEEIKKSNSLRTYKKDNILNASSIWLTFESLIEVNRPEIETGWKLFSSSGKIAWKTGTSFGFRDGWAIGTTPQYTVGVWAGNADGEGRPGLTGVQTAAPIMFDVFDLLPRSNWFQIPLDEMRKIPVCRQSGHRPGPYCKDIDTIWTPETGLSTSPCSYHVLVHLNKSGQFRVNRDCLYDSEIRHESWFVLPPVQAWYYKSKRPDYKILPPLDPQCINEEEIPAMDLIYPQHTARIYVPIDMNGEKGQVVFEAAHRRPNATIFWHLDDQYIGSTQQIHQMGATPGKGLHTLTLVDKTGQILTRRFEILDN